MNHNSKHETWADVAVFQNLKAGQALEGCLKDKGLEARTYDDRLFRYFLFLRPPRVTYRVQVRKSHFQAAHDYVAAGAAEVLQQAIRCPSCDSLQIEYPQMTRKFILPTILLHLGIIFRVIDHECFCNHCHFIWNLPEEQAVQAVKHAIAG